MQRAIVLTAVVLLLIGCDPLRKLSVSRPITAPLDRTCVIEALRMEKTVRTVDATNPGKIWAELIIPDYLESPRRGVTGFFVEEARNDKGTLEINFSTGWVGPSGSREYRAYVDKTLQELRDRVIERCGR